MDCLWTPLSRSVGSSNSFLAIVCQWCTPLRRGFLLSVSLPLFYSRKWSDIIGIIGEVTLFGRRGSRDTGA